MLAIKREDAKGDITGSSNVLWSRTWGTFYEPSPLLHTDAIWFLRHLQGILSRVNARTEVEPSGPFRLGDIRDVYASSVAAAGRIYVTDLDGTTVVITGDQNPKLLTRNRLDDSFSASVAIVGEELLLRGRRSLYCISEQP